MATESDNQELADRFDAATIDAPDATERFIVPWRMERSTDRPLKPIKEDDPGECGCGISSDDNY